MVENPYKDLELRRELIRDDDGRYQFYYVVYLSGKEVVRDTNQNRAERLALQKLGRDKYVFSRRY
jgi:hypothetical protein